MRYGIWYGMVRYSIVRLYGTVSTLNLPPKYEHVEIRCSSEYILNADNAALNPSSLFPSDESWLCTKTWNKNAASLSGNTAFPRSSFPWHNNCARSLTTANSAVPSGSFSNRPTNSTSWFASFTCGIISSLMYISPQNTGKAKTTNSMRRLLYTMCVQLGDITDDMWAFIKLKRSEERFLSLRRRSNPQPSYDR